MLEPMRIEDVDNFWATHGKHEDEINKRFPKGYRAVKPYLRLTPQPNK